MATQNIDVTLTAWARKTQQRMEAIWKQSTQAVADDANTPVAKGGRMHVDTGFLRASQSVSLTGMPSGPVRGAKDQKYDTQPDVTAAKIAGAKIGQTIFVGWTANYAQARENKDAFMRMATQKWPQTVASITAQLKASIK